VIVLLNQKISYRFLLPKKFKYFTTNPELLQNLSVRFNTVDISPEGYLSKDYYNEIVNFQKDLLHNKLHEIFNPNTINYHENFRKTKSEYYTLLKKKLKKKYGEKVVCPKQIGVHKNLRLYLFFSLQNLKLRGHTLLLIIPSIYNLIRFMLDSNKTLVISSLNHFKFISKNFPKSNFYLTSKNFRKSNTVNLDTLFAIYKFFVFIPLLLKFSVHLRKLHNYKIKYSNSLLFKNYCLYHFAKLINQIAKFKIIATSSYGLSESFLNINRNNILINHGAYYIDRDELINTLWKFQSQTILSTTGLIVSTNYDDKSFMKFNGFTSKFNLLRNTIRSQASKVKSLNSKIILIADTFKTDDFLRPYLYHDVNLYLRFIKIILEKAPNHYKVILRHRKGTIISEDFLKKRFPMLILSTNNSIDLDFQLDPILFSYSSTTLMEARGYGIRTVSFDAFNSNLNFLNNKIFNDIINNLPDRYNYHINSIKSLKDFFKLLS
jgi:hypothetical protein